MVRIFDSDKSKIKKKKKSYLMPLKIKILKK